MKKKEMLSNKRFREVLKEYPDELTIALEDGDGRLSPFKLNQRSIADTKFLVLEVEEGIRKIPQSYNLFMLGKMDSGTKIDRSGSNSQY